MESPSSTQRPYAEQSYAARPAFSPVLVFAIVAAALPSIAVVETWRSADVAVAAVTMLWFSARLVQGLRISLVATPTHLVIQARDVTVVPWSSIEAWALHPSGPTRLTVRGASIWVPTHLLSPLSMQKVFGAMAARLPPPTHMAGLTPDWWRVLDAVVLLVLAGASWMSLERLSSHEVQLAYGGMGAVALVGAVLAWRLPKRSPRVFGGASGCLEHMIATAFAMQLVVIRDPPSVVRMVMAATHGVAIVAFAVTACVLLGLDVGPRASEAVRSSS